MSTRSITILNRTRFSAGSGSSDASARGLAPRIELSLIVPAFNAARVLRHTLPEIIEACEKYRAELIVVDDGSTDSTLTVLGRHLRNVRACEVVWHPTNLGKGAAVRSGVERARGRFVLFVDADLSPDLRTGIDWALELLERHEVVMSSRAVEGAVVSGASWFRKALGLGFRLAQRSIVGLEYPDTQCGLKGFEVSAAKVLFHYLRTDGFAFDVEVLWRAHELGLGVAQFPIRWEERYGSTVRPLVDGAKMLRQLFSIRGLEPRLGRPVPSVFARPVPQSSAGDSGGWVEAWPEKLAGIMRKGDVVVKEGGGLRVLLFSSPTEAATVVARRVAAVLGDDAEVSSAAYDAAAAFDAAKRYFASRRTQHEPA